MAEVVKLGDRVRDRVSGLVGIAVARTRYLSGCDRISIQPPIGNDGKVPDYIAADEMMLEVIKAGAVQPVREEEDPLIPPG